MINRIAIKIVKRLINSSVISESEQELYLYGCFVLISQVLYFILTIIIGILLDIVLESIIFYLAFQFIRRYAGGIHASSELKCEIATTISIFACLLSAKLCETYGVQNPTLILTVMAAIVVFVLCPLDTPEKPLTKEENRYFRKIARIILLLIIVTIYVGWHFKLEFLMYPCCMGVILESILLSLGFINKSFKRKYN